MLGSAERQRAKASAEAADQDYGLHRALRRSRGDGGVGGSRRVGRLTGRAVGNRGGRRVELTGGLDLLAILDLPLGNGLPAVRSPEAIGRESCRERVCQFGYLSGAP